MAKNTLQCVYGKSMHCAPAFAASSTPERVAFLSCLSFPVQQPSAKNLGIQGDNLGLSGRWKPISAVPIASIRLSRASSSPCKQPMCSDQNVPSAEWHAEPCRQENEILVLQLKVAAIAHLASDFMEITAVWMLYPKARLLCSVQHRK